MKIEERKELEAELENLRKEEEFYPNDRQIDERIETIIDLLDDTESSEEVELLHNYNTGDVVTINENDIDSSEDKEFLEKYIGVPLVIASLNIIDNELVHYFCNDKHGNAICMKKDNIFPFIDADLKKYKSKTVSIEDIIKTHICEDIFQNGYPSDLDNLHPYDFFMRADVDCTEDVESSALCTEWNFEVSGEYALDNIRAIRGTMQSMFSDLERLKTSLFEHAVKMVNVSLDDFEDENRFYDFIQDANANLYEQGAPNEHAIVLTVDVEVVS